MRDLPSPAGGCPAPPAVRVGLPADEASRPSCGLPLHGPHAGRLWRIDQQLRLLGEERLSVLARLRSAGSEASGQVWAPTAGPAAV